jgi:RND family efflux transporter MFP subunit
MSTPKSLKRFLQGFVILGFLVVAVFLVWFLKATKPEALEKSAEVDKPLVEVMPVRFASITVKVDSQGMIQAKKRTQLASELSGKVVQISDKFNKGGQFKEGETILELDSSSYLAAVAEAEAALVEAEVELTTEKAKAEQARLDWQRLGKGKASALTLREPQLRRAESQISATKATLAKAKRDLQRTVIKAPFDATVSAKSTEIGNFLAPGSPVGEFFQTAPLEVRTPLSLHELQFLNTSPDGKIIGDVTLTTTIGDQEAKWKGRIDRTEGQVERESRAIYLISEIDPKQNRVGNPIPPQPGLFVNTGISGRKFDHVARVPATAFLDLNRVVLVSKEGKLEFRAVKVLRREGDYVYVSDGLNENENLCLTELATMIEGTLVESRPVPSVKKNGKIDADNR